MERMCEHCGVVFHAPPCRVKVGGGRYCSRSCKAKDRVGERNSNWRGGKQIRNDGRVLIYRPNHPGAIMNGTYVLEYRLEAEKKIGRFLNNDEVVHHINGNATDNRPENLEVMMKSEHAKLECVRKDSITGRFIKKKDEERCAQF